MVILATFHTHPNTEANTNRSRLADIDAVKDDPDLGGPDYEGELVISETSLYRVLKDGTVEVLGETKVILDLP